MKIYIAMYDEEKIIKDDFNNEERYCFLSEKDALEDIRNNGDSGYVIECEIKSIKATFPPRVSGKLYPVEINIK